MKETFGDTPQPTTAHHKALAADCALLLRRNAEPALSGEPIFAVNFG
jgi:hypothetical protein